MSYIDNGANIIIGDNRIYYCWGHDQFGETIYKEYDFHRTSQISAAKYLEAKLGPINANQELIDYQIAKLSDGRFLSVCYRKENQVRLHAKDGTILRTLNMIKGHFGLGIYDIAVDSGDRIWIVCSTEHYIGQFDLLGREVFSFKGTKALEPGIFDTPESITTYGESIFVTDLGNRRVAKINTQSNEVTTYLNIAEGIYEFHRVGNHEIYKLYSGIYSSPKGVPPQGAQKRYLP